MYVHILTYIPTYTNHTPHTTHHTPHTTHTRTRILVRTMTSTQFPRCFFFAARVRRRALMEDEADLAANFKSAQRFHCKKNARQNLTFAEKRTLFESTPLRMNVQIFGMTKTRRCRIQRNATSCAHARGHERHLFWWIRRC